MESVELALCEVYLEQKLVLFNRLYVFTEAIIKLLDLDDIKDLEELMQKYQQVIDEVCHLDGVYNNKFSLMEMESPKLVADIKKLRVLMQDIQKMENEIQQKMSLSRKTKLEKFNKTKKFRKVQSSYNNYSHFQGNLLDKQR